MPIPELVESAGPFKGMRWSRSFTPDKAYCEFIKNGMLADPISGGPILSRPGQRLLNDAELGDGSTGHVQLVYQFDLKGGTRHSIVMVDGIIYKAGWTAGSLAEFTWTERVSAADMTSAGVALGAGSPRVYAVTFQDKMVIASDGGTPFMWDGTAGAGGLTNLSNAPVTWSPPTVYAGKVFFVKNTERGTIVWSEEADATTGYEAGGFNNAWTLEQTGHTLLYRILGTNEGLYFFRQSSIGIIRGAVNTTFTTDATKDSVSEEVGTVSPDSVVLHQNRIWFVDQFARPQLFYVGGSELVPLWKDMARLFSSETNDARGYGLNTIDDLNDVQRRLASNQLAVVSASYIPGTDLIMFGQPDFNANVVGENKHFFMFSTLTFELQSMWQFPVACRRLGILFDSANYRFILGYGRGDGWVFSLGAEGQLIDDDEPTGTDVGVVLELIGPRQFDAHDVEVQFDRIDMNGESHTAETISVGYYTPPRIQDNSNTTQTFTTAGLRQSLTYPNPFHESLGITGIGRWFALYLSSDSATVAGRSKFFGWTITGFPLARHPAID